MTNEPREKMKQAKEIVDAGIAIFTERLTSKPKIPISLDELQTISEALAGLEREVERLKTELRGSIFASCPYHQWKEDSDVSTLLLSNNKYTVWCRRCGIHAPIEKETKEEAIKAWNELMEVTTYKLKEDARRYHEKLKEPTDAEPI